MTRTLTGVLACISLAVSVEATSIQSVRLANLFREADLVAVVSIEGADARAFKDAVYRATVLEPFKGASKDATIYFGPFVHYRLGGEYVVFLKSDPLKVGETLQHEPSPWPEAADANLFRIMYAGYSMLPVEFTCVFPECAWGVSIPSAQVIVPPELTLVRHECDPGSNYDSWAKKDAFLGLLRAQRPGAAK